MCQKSSGKATNLVDSPTPGADNDAAKTGTTPEPNSSSKPVRRKLFPDAPNSGSKMRNFDSVTKTEPDDDVAGVADEKPRPSDRSKPYDAAKRSSLGAGGSSAKRNKTSTPSKASKASKVSKASKASDSAKKSKSGKAPKMWERGRQKNQFFNQLYPPVS